MFERRRAERFAELLEEAEGVRRRHVRRGRDSELASFVELTRRVGSVPVTGSTGAPPATGAAAEPDEEFRIGLRAMLMATIEREGIGATAIDQTPDPTPAPAPPEPRRSRVRAGILVGVTAGALALSGVSAASGDAMPGDALYPVKRNGERAQLALAGSDVSRGNLYLEFARTRLGEAGQVSADRVPGVLADMDSQTQEGVRLLTSAAMSRGDASALSAVEGFAARQREGLAGLGGKLDPAGKARVGESAELLTQVGTRVADLRQALACGSRGSTLDHLGPVPVACPVRAPAEETPQTDAADPEPDQQPDAGTPPSVEASPVPAKPSPSADPAAASPAPAGAPVTTAGPDAGLLGDLGQALGSLLG